VTPAKILIGGLAVVGLFVAATSASAQRLGTRIGRDATPKDAAAAMEILAGCAVDRRANFVRKWFTLLPGTSEEGALLKSQEADLSACMDDDALVLDGKELAFQPISMRYPVAAAWGRKHLKNGPLESPVPATSDPWFLPKLNDLSAGASVDRSALILQDFGHCVAVHEWAGARALLLSQPDSQEQRAAVAKLVPVLGPCLSEDVEITLTPENLRRVLAEPVYHIVAASAGRQE
jgi:hypothetical protein